MKNALYKSFFVSLIILLGVSFGALASADNASQPITLTRSGTYDASNGTITYQTNWSVASANPISNLVLNEPIPLGTTFVSASGGGNLANNAVVWNLGVQPGGATGTVTSIVSVDAALALNRWANRVVSYTPGTTKQGSSLPALISNPSNALGQADGNFVALGFGSTDVGGQIVLAFSLPIINGPGADLKIFGLDTTNPQNKVLVEVSNDLTNWVTLGTALGSSEFDLGNLGSANYVRLTGLSDRAQYGPTGEGAYVDAVENLHLYPLSCGIVDILTASGSAANSNFAVSSPIRTDLVQDCGAGSGSGASGIPGVSGSGTPSISSGGTTPPPAGGSASAGNQGGGGGSTAQSAPIGGGGGSGGSAPSGGGSSLPAGQVAGVSTTTPEGLGGFEESLPRTGLPGGIVVALAGLVVLGCLWHPRPTNLS